MFRTIILNGSQLSILLSWSLLYCRYIHKFRYLIIIKLVVATACFITLRYNKLLRLKNLKHSVLWRSLMEVGVSGIPGGPFLFRFAGKFVPHKTGDNTFPVSHFVHHFFFVCRKYTKKVCWTDAI